VESILHSFYNAPGRRGGLFGIFFYFEEYVVRRLLRNSSAMRWGGKSMHET
jgi:hypothetical protein